MKILSAVIAAFLSLTGIAQQRVITPEMLHSTAVNKLICIDMSGRVTQVCSLGLDGFSVEFYKATFYPELPGLRIEGRLNPPLPGIGIFMGSEDSVFINSPLSRTSNDEEHITNDGFFDITLVLKKGEFLYFYERPYFARKFDISKLLDKD